MSVREDILRRAMGEDTSLTAKETPSVWTFKDKSVATKFDDHVREQLSWYDALSRYCADMCVSFVPNAGVVYDIGASTGNMTRLMADDLKQKAAKVISIEPSHQMAEMWHGPGDLHVIDAEKVNFSDRPDLAILFLALMFFPPAQRDTFLRRLLASVKPGGAVLLVDKGYLYTPALQTACRTSLMASKKRAGMSSDAYVTKELSLRGEQRPTDRYAILDLMLAQGFDAEEFFRFGEFYGVLAIKKSLKNISNC